MKHSDGLHFFSERSMPHFAEVIISTGSHRKAVMWLIQQMQFAFYSGMIEETQQPIPITPENFDAWLKREIRNGNNVLIGKEKVGRFGDSGIPVFAQDGKGEGKSTNASEESRNKASALAEKYLALPEEERKPVVIVATDSVSKVKYVDGRVVELLKPMNQGYITETFDPDAYLEVHYPPGSKIIQTTAVTVCWVAPDESGAWSIAEKTEVFSLTVVVDAEKLKNAVVAIDAAGGGVLQSQIDWDKPESVFDEALIPFLVVGLEKFSEEDRLEVLKFRLYCHIAGMPYWAILKMYQEGMPGETNLENMVDLDQEPVVAIL